MRILFFTNEYSHPKLPAHGGVGTFFKTISKQMKSQGHEVFIYGFSKKKYEINDDGIKIVFFKQFSKSKPFAELIRSISSKFGYSNIEEYWLVKERKFLAKKLKSFAIKHNIDIIQSFTFNGFTAYWDNSIPLVTRFHGSRGFWHQYLGKEFEKLKIKMEKRALEITPYTVANSNFSKRFIKDYYDVDVDAVIPNGIDINHFAPKREINEKVNSIYYVGTLSEAKGVDNLAKIFNRIVKLYPNATLNLIGRGEKYFTFLRDNVLSSNAAKNVNYFSHVSLSDIPKKLAEASVIVIPTKGETFGFTIVEAMAMEKVTIVSDVPVAKEIVTSGQDGFIAKDTNEFIEIIKKVFDEPQKYDELKTNARQKVLNNYTLDLMTKNTLEYYKKILNK